MAPKCKSRDAGNSDKPKRSWKALSEKACTGKAIVYRGAVPSEVLGIY